MFNTVCEMCNSVYQALAATNGSITSVTFLLCCLNMLMVTKAKGNLYRTVYNTFNRVTAQGIYNTLLLDTANNYSFYSNELIRSASGKGRPEMQATPQ